MTETSWESSQFPRHFTLKSLPSPLNTGICFSQSTPLSYSASQKKDTSFWKRCCSFLLRAGVSHLQNVNKTQNHTVINKYVKTDIKKEAIINCKSLWVTDLVLLDFIFSLQFRTHSLPFQLWIHSPMFSPTAWLSVTSNFPVPSRLSVRVKIMLCFLIKPCHFIVPCVPSILSNPFSYLLLLI